MRFGATMLARHMSSQPTAMPASASRPASFSSSAMASTAGTITAPACTGPPSNVSSKSSPRAADHDAERDDAEDACERNGERAADEDDDEAQGAGEHRHQHAAGALRSEVKRDADAQERIERRNEAQVRLAGFQYGGISREET